MLNYYVELLGCATNLDRARGWLPHELSVATGVQNSHRIQMDYLAAPHIRTARYSADL